jgi:hypothetical protein
VLRKTRVRCNACLNFCLQTSYILAVNSGILSDTGGTCSDANCTVRQSGPEQHLKCAVQPDCQAC